MPTVQLNYNSRLSNGQVGQIADLGESNVISRDVQPVGGIGFGVPVIQGTGENQCTVGAAGNFLGITVRDPAVDATANDRYVQNSNASIMTRGVIWVTAGEAVSFGDVVYRTSAGVLNKTSSGNTLIAGARWESTVGSGALAKLRLGV